MKSLVERLRARLSNPEKVIGRPGWKDPVIFPPASAEMLANAEKELGFTLPQTLRMIYLEVANGGIGPSFGLLGITGGATGEQSGNAVDVYRAYRSHNDLDHDDEDLSENERNWHWPESMLPICYHGCTVYVCINCKLPDPPVCIVDVGNQDWNEPFEQTAPSLAAWFETWLRETDSPEPSWLNQLDDGQGFQTVTWAGFSATPMRTAQMPYIVRLKNLRGLCLSGCPVSDESLVHLRQLKRLQTLKLVGTKISDAGLHHLCALKTLRNLNLTGVPISEKGLAALEAALPKCDVIWSPPEDSAST
jgi:hypothetical protein